jgi:hypothetical protein
MAETALLQALRGVIDAELAIRVAPDLVAFADAVEDWLNRHPEPSDTGQ